MMKQTIKHIIAILLVLVLAIQNMPVNAYAKQITGNATVYIKTVNGNDYLYADGSDVKYGALKEKNMNYVWTLTLKQDGTYWIQNMGTSTYMCLEHANGTVKLEGTIYEVWQSSKWYIKGNATSSTIDNMWKTSTTGNEGGYIYTTGDGVARYGTTAQQWVFEDFSLYSDVEDDGESGKLNGTSAADSIGIPQPSTDLSKIGATMPYIRYDSESATLGGGAVLAVSKDWDLANVASQASNQSYVSLPAKGDFAEWKMFSEGDGVTMRFTLPDSADGMGTRGSVDIYVNDQKVKTVDLTSYYMWQYLKGGASDTAGNGGAACFAFDEVHFRLDASLQVGDRIRVQSNGAAGLGVDFLEIEETGGAIPQPAGSYAVTDFGAVPDDGADDYAAITACIAAANAAGKDVYFPAGTYHLNQMWKISAHDMMITGAGMWYTNIQFTSDQQSGGGVSGAGDGNTYNVEFCNMYLNSNLRSRYGENAIYKAFMDVFDGKSLIHDIWEEHFECGFWIADYNGSLDYSDEIKIVNCRIRNNLADGVNFCQGTSNATVYNCSIRNNGDDGLAMWNNNYMNAKDESNNVFCYNTIDFIWRAGGIAIYGGNGHQIYNNYIRDCFMASGIHLNTTFPGYKFDNTQQITFSNNIIVRSGCSYDTWGSEYGAIDLTGATKNVTFQNTYIYDAQHDGIRIGDNVSAIVFNDLYIYGTGRDTQTPSYSALPHLGAAFMCFSGNPSVTVNGLHLNNVAYANTHYNLNNANVTLNNVIKENGVYTIPGYPANGSIGTDHSDHYVHPVPIPTTAETVEPSSEEPTSASEEPSSEETSQDDDTEPYGNPDMVVTDITWTPANPAQGDAVIFTAIVKNQGTGVAPAGSINGAQFQIDGTCVTWSDNNTDQILPGQSVAVTAVSGPNDSASWSAVTGTHTVLAWVNDVLRYPESNTANNQFSKSITVTAEHTSETEESSSEEPTSASEEPSSEETSQSIEPYGNPDMVVTDITWTPANPAQGDAVIFTAIVKNQGTGVAPAGSINGAQFQIDGTCVTWSDNNTDQILPGQSVAVTAVSGPNDSASWSAVTGTHTVLAWVNDVLRYPESNTANNQFSKSITVTAEPTVEVVEPAIVTGVKAVYDNGTVHVTWDDNGAEMYKVVRSDGRSGYQNLTYKATAAGWNDSKDLIDAQLYYYRVIGYFRDAQGNLVMGEQSDAAGVVVLDGAPAKTENVKTTINGKQVTLTWDEVDHVRYYKVSRAAGATGKYYSMKYNITDPTYTETVTAGLYRYKVVGYYKDVDGGWVYGDLSDTIYVTVT